MSLTGSGIFANQAIMRDVIQDGLAGTHRTYRIVAGNGDKFESVAEISGIERNGEYNDSEQFSLTWESSGEVFFTAAISGQNPRGTS